MNTLLEEINETSREASLARMKMNKLVDQYIKENVDKTDLDSLEKAISDLPECDQVNDLRELVYDILGI